MIKDLFTLHKSEEKSKPVVFPPSLSVISNNASGPGCSKARAVNANPGLKDYRSNNFSSTEMFFTAYVLCCMRLVKLKTEGKTIQTKNVIENAQK